MTITFFIYKLVGFIATPLGLFLFILVVTPFWAGKNKKKLFWTLFSSTAFLMIMSMNVTANSMLKGLENIVPEIPSDSYAKGDVAVLVLSAGSASTYNSTLTPDPYAISRIVAGLKIAKDNKWPLVFSGGLGSSEKQSLAETMKVYARDLGYSGLIILEEKSRTTWENMLYSLEILKKYHYNKVVLVTSSFHMKRTLWNARRVMPDIKLYPYPVGAIGDKNTPLGWIPNIGGLFKSSLAWKEYLGLFVYKLLFSHTSQTVILEQSQCLYIVAVRVAAGDLAVVADGEADRTSAKVNRAMDGMYQRPAATGQLRGISA